MIHLELKEGNVIPNISELLEKHHEYGGSIVQYKRVFSMISVCHKSCKYIWVAPGNSRVYAGLKHTLFCAAFGWWSLFGFVWTIAALVQNLTGGINVTSTLIGSSKPGLQYQSNDDQTNKEQQRLFIIQFLVFATLFILFATLAYRGSTHPK